MCKTKFDWSQYIPFVFKYFVDIINSMSEASVSFPPSIFDSFYFICKELFCNRRYKLILRFFIPQIM